MSDVSCLYLMKVIIYALAARCPALQDCGKLARAIESPALILANLIDEQLIADDKT